nr:hypothetical protein [Phenylobacterium sp. J367]
MGPSSREIRGALQGPNANSARLADELSSAIVAFAATGDPNTSKLPKWPPYEPTRRETLVFDNPASRVESDPPGAVPQAVGDAAGRVRSAAVFALRQRCRYICSI